MRWRVMRGTVQMLTANKDESFTCCARHVEAALR
jgi:hypothetical protein